MSIWNKVNVGSATSKASIPGPDTFTGGNTTAGFYGEVLSSDFIDGETLASSVGLVVGTPANTTTNWIKYSLDGKTLFIPMHDIRYDISWDDLYQCGLVYGDNTTGKYPTGTLTLQNKQVTIKGNQYIVRLLRGLRSDPINATAAYSSPHIVNSEWNRIFFRICFEANTSEGSKFAYYTHTDLGFTNPYWQYHWTQEKNTYSYPEGRVLRGYHSFFTSDKSSVFPIASTTHYCWRPVLELIPPV